MRRSCTYAALLVFAGAACRDRPESSAAAAAARDTIVVYPAASLTKPLQAALDTFAARSKAVVQRESGGSLEHARKLTELGGRIPAEGRRMMRAAHVDALDRAVFVGTGALTAIRDTAGP